MNAEFCVSPPSILVPCNDILSNKKVLSFDRTFFDNWRELDAGKAGVDFAEYIADNRSEDHEGRNNDDGYQNEN